MDENAATLAAYEVATAAYLAATPPRSASHLAFLEQVRAFVPPGARVLEIGSGPGDDAEWLEAAGLRVTRSDATQGFVDRLRAAGHEALRLDVTVDDLGGPYDLVFANAVLLHLTVAQFDHALSRLPSDRLAMTLKEGDGGAWSTAKLDRPRWFTYWREPALRERLADAGWEVQRLDRVDGRLEPWLMVLAVRRWRGARGGR